MGVGNNDHTYEAAGVPKVAPFASLHQVGTDPHIDGNHSYERPSVLVKPGKEQEGKEAGNDGPQKIARLID